MDMKERLRMIAGKVNSRMVEQQDVDDDDQSVAKDGGGGEMSFRNPKGQARAMGAKGFISTDKGGDTTYKKKGENKGIKKWKAMVGAGMAGKKKKKESIEDIALHGTILLDDFPTPRDMIAAVMDGKDPDTLISFETVQGSEDE